jgi:hypothetical protein
MCHVIGGHLIKWNFSLAKGWGNIGHLAFFFKSDDPLCHIPMPGINRKFSE